MTGKFISVEGGEGAGKSTNIAFIKQFLQAAGKTVVETREPGGTPIAEQIRDLLLDTRNRGLDSDAELLLMFAARAEHIAKVIKPSLAQGHWVLCDRFTDATYAYQGEGRGIASQRIAVLEDWVQGSLRPDVTILFDLPVAVGMARAGKRGPQDRFEQEKTEFFERVRQGYLSLSRQHASRFRVIDASRELDAVQTALGDLLSELL